MMIDDSEEKKHFEDKQLHGLTRCQACPEPPEDSFTLQFDLFQGSGFVDPIPFSYDLQVSVSIGSQKMPKDSRSVTVRRATDGKTNIAEWYESFSDLRVQFPSYMDSIPDIFINVYKRSKNADDPLAKERLGFIRLKASDIPFNNNPPVWMQLIPDRLSNAYLEQHVMRNEVPKTGALQVCFISFLLCCILLNKREGRKGRKKN